MIILDEDRLSFKTLNAIGYDYYILQQDDETKEEYYQRLVERLQLKEEK